MPHFDALQIQEGHDDPGSLTWVIFPTIEFYIFVPLVPTCDPQGRASFDSKGIIWIRLIKVHKEMLNTKYQSSNPFSFREEELWSRFSLFLCSNLWPTCDPRAGPVLTPRTNLAEVHKEMLNTKYQSSLPSSSEEKNFEDEILCSYVPTCDPLGPILNPGASSKQTW